MFQTSIGKSEIAMRFISSKFEIIEQCAWIWFASISSISILPLQPFPDSIYKLVTTLLSLCKIRSGRKPDGMCLVVGACAHGFEKNTTSDIIFSSSSVKRAGNSGVQLFWEVIVSLRTYNTKISELLVFFILLCFSSITYNIIMIS